MSMEDIEMNRYRKKLDKDVEKLVDKYIEIMDEEIPEIDEPKARRLILEELRSAISRINPA